MEFSRLVQSDRIHRLYTIAQGDVLQIEGGISGVCDMTSDMKSRMLATGKEHDCQKHEYFVGFHSGYAIFVVQR